MLPQRLLYPGVGAAMLLSRVTQTSCTWMRLVCFCAPRRRSFGASLPAASLRFTESTTLRAGPASSQPGHDPHPGPKHPSRSTGEPAWAKRELPPSLKLTSCCGVAESLLACSDIRISIRSLNNRKALGVPVQTGHGVATYRNHLDKCTNMNENMICAYGMF